jgi:hypothetical protein
MLLRCIFGAQNIKQHGEYATYVGDVTKNVLGKLPVIIKILYFLRHSYLILIGHEPSKIQ